MHGPKARIKVRIVLKYIFLGAITLVFLMPFIFMITNSFMQSTEIIDNYRVDNKDDYYNITLIPQKVTLEQYYKVLFRNPDYIRQFWNSVILTFPSVLLQIIVSFAAAYAFAKIKFAGRNILFILVLLIMLLPMQVTLVPNFMVLNFLELNEKYMGIILSSAFAPLGVCLLRQYLMYIPDDTIEASKIDGAGHMHIMFRILLPQAKTGLAAVGILSFIQNWNMVEQPLLLLKDRVKQPLSVLMSSYEYSNFGIVFAAGVVFMVPALIIFFLGQKYIVLGIKMYRRR